MAVRFTVEWHPDEAAIKHMLTGAGGMVDVYLASLARECVIRAKALAPVSTGALKDSIKADRDRPGWRVIAMAPYSLAVHEGTKAHPIAPRSPRKALRFPSKSGTIVYTTKVNHPGTGAHPFLTTALRQVV